MTNTDPLWPRASDWLARGDDDPDLVVVGVPCSVGSITASDAWATPAALREVLARFSTFDGETATDLTSLRVADLGNWDVADVGLADALARIESHAGRLEPGPVHAFVGGDNAITRPLVGGVARGDLARMGVLTFDAHHDVRVLDSGPNNGTPIRGLIVDGLPGGNVVQVGIHSFANSAAYRGWCEEQGVTAVTMADVDRDGIEAVVDEALARLAAHCDRIYVDVDIDVLDRAFAPACPGARPGGMTPRQLAAACRAVGAHAKVVAADFVEVDAHADVAMTTMMNLATAILAFASGVARRRETVT